MEILKILSEIENSLLNRKELKLTVEAEKNPSFSEIENLLSEKFKAEKEKIAIKKIKGKFGRNTFLINCFVYRSKEDKERYEKKEAVKEEKKEEPVQIGQEIKQAEMKPAEVNEEKKS